MTAELLLSGLLIGTLGLGLFMYGKRAEDYRCLAGGVVIMVFPYFVHSVLLMWLMAAACLGGLYAWVRHGPGL